MRRRANKSTGLAITLLLLAAACFPDLDPSHGSLTIGLLGVGEAVDTVRVTVTADSSRHVTTSPLSPAATVRIDVVPVGAVAVLVEALAKETLVQSRGMNTEVMAGENEIAVDLGSAGPNTPKEVRSAEQRVTIRVRDEQGVQVEGQEPIAREAFASFLSNAEVALGAPPRTLRVDRASVVAANGALGGIWNGAVALSLVDDAGATVTLGSFAPAGASATVDLADADLSPLMNNIVAGRFDVRVAGPGSGSPDTEVEVTLVFAASAE